VWKALTTSEGLCQWLVDDARFEGRKGGRVVVSAEDEAGNPIEECGLVHTWRPTSHLELAWDSIGKGPNKGTRWLFQLARDGDETRVSLVHSGSALDDEMLRTMLEQDWSRSMRALQEWLDE